jgi:hypothetical protein
MDTDRLISTLSQDLRPVRGNGVARRLGIGLLLGAIVTTGMVLYWLGMRHDWVAALSSYHFWMKWL